MSVGQTESVASDVGARGAAGSDALLFATVHAEDGEPAALLTVGETTALGRLLAQLESLGVGRAWVVARPAWRGAIEAETRASAAEVIVIAADGLGEELGATVDVAASRRAPLVVASANLVAHREVIANLLVDPRIGSGALVAGSPRPEVEWARIRIVRNRLESAESSYHRVTGPNGSFLGLVKVAAPDRGRLIRAAEELAGLAAGPPAGWDAAPSPRATDTPSLLLVGLLRSGVDLHPMGVRGFVAGAPRSMGAAQRVAAELVAVDEDRARLDAAVKTYDGFFSTFFVNPFAKHLARSAARAGLTPNVVTLVSLTTGVAAAASFATGSRLGLVVGALLLLASFYLDGADGQLARYMRTFSSLGAWLDSVCDRSKEYLVYAGLAIGSTRGFDDDVWVLAAAALALQTVRHLGDVAYVTVRQSAPQVAPPPLDVASDGLSTGDGAAPGEPRHGSGVRAAARRSSLTTWAHRIIRFPVGERLALIALTAALATPRATFVALLAWGGFAAVYTVIGRVAHDHPATSRIVRGVLR